MAAGESNALSPRDAEAIGREEVTGHRRRSDDYDDDRQEDLREFERLRQRLALVGAAAKVGIWEYDFERDELWVSDELARLYGTTTDVLTWSEFVSRIHPDDVVAPVANPTPSYPFGEVNDFMFRVRHDDGTYRNIRSRSTTYGEGDRPVRKLGAHIDMSDDTMFRVAELSNANERLRQFAYMASHDLRSPLRAIRNLIDFIIDDHGSSLPDEAAKMLEEIDARAGGLDRLVVDMLDYATADLKDTRPAPTTIRRLIDDVIATTDARQCRIVVDCDIVEPVNLTGEPLSACVRNLVDNACKYHDKPAGTVTVTAHVDGVWLRVEIADDGPGIPPGVQNNVFDAFKTTDPTTSSGLGLAHVRDQIDKHDATIELVSDPEVGTRFTVRWPIIELEATDAHDVSPPS